MKISLLYGAAPNYSLGLAGLVNIAMNVLTELGLEVKQIDLPSLQLPLFDGASCEAADGAISSVKKSSGVILAATAVTPGPSAALENFLEYCSLPEGQSAFENKNCMLLVVSQNGWERFCLETLSHTLYAMGAYDSVRVGLRRDSAEAIETREEIRTIFEKQLEDYFRVVRQSRKFLLPAKEPMIPSEGASINQREKMLLESIQKKQKAPLSEIIQKLNLESMNENQIGDVNAITKFFAQKFSEPEPNDGSSPIFIESGARDPGAEPRVNTCRHLTRNLPRQFQPQLAQGLEAVLQVQISGEENFGGYYTIQGMECGYSDGTALNPDITIFSDSSVWNDVLTGQYTAQKAFMIGRLKVKGNYVILTKFDHVFQIRK
ncbi:MAG: SCP2 sterol-binding domain-containing protein [Clostridiales bacterium]|jgi:putative sterol carrier protein|nr:SCP2 sterol-binding domain-containing protein [Clostridiales bacterium]